MGDTGLDAVVRRLSLAVCLIHTVTHLATAFALVAAHFPEAEAVVTRLQKKGMQRMRSLARQDNRHNSGPKAEMHAYLDSRRVRNFHLHHVVLCGRGGRRC